MNDNVNNDPMDLKIYTVAEVAALLHVSKETIYSFLRSGKLAHVKLGKTFIRHQTLVNFLNAQETTQFWESGVYC